MNKLLVTILLATLTAGAFAAPKKVNAAILYNFQNAFKEASDVTWLISRDFTKAAFTADNTKMEAYYNSNGDIIATSKSIDLDELPVNAKRSFAKKFEGYTVTEAIRFEGFDEAAYYISGENERESVILKVDENNKVSVYTKKRK